MSLISTNPATGERLAEHPAMTDAEVDAAIQSAATAQQAWAALSVAERAPALRAAAAVLRARKDDLARLMAQEMGKPLRAAAGEIEKCAAGCDWFANAAADLLAEETYQTEASRCLVRYEPLGTVLAIMPWNFPFWQVFRAAAPILMAGSAVLLKHAPNVTGCALAIGEVLAAAGLPDHLFGVLRMEAERTGRVLASAHVHGVTLTGSDRAGVAVAALAGRYLKPCVLELGGSDPFLVLPDADLERTATIAATARCQNTGQSCIAAKRFLVFDGIYDAFLERFTTHLQALRVGDPLDPDTELGPMARLDLRDNVHRQVQESVAAGARLAFGGEMPDGPGAFYPVTLLTDVRPGMPAYDEEVFGPVAAVIRVSDEDEAVRVANDTPFGLGASVWTEDHAAAERLIPRLRCGQVFVNEMVRSDARVPFGGVKRSGYGRELGEPGIKAFTSAKTVWVR